jgi:hypothetical protein
VAIVVGVSAGGFALLLVPVGIVDTGIGFFITAIGDNHKKYKWNYKIITNNNQNL